MPRRTQRSAWPSDDQVRERDNDRDYTDDGRKLHDSDRVGAMAPDTDAERQPSRKRSPQPSSQRTGARRSPAKRSRTRR